MALSYNAFFEALGQRESSNNYQAENSLGYIGKYQMGELSLIDVGYYLKDNTTSNDWIGQWTGKNEIQSKSDFLNNPSVQDQAVRQYAQVNWRYASTSRLGKIYSTTQGFTIYEGQILNGKEITISGIIAGMHLLGIGGLNDYIKKGGISTNADANGVKFATYLEELGGYNTPFTVDHSGNDILIGGNGMDELYGFGGNDRLTGNGNNDRLDGEAGSDQLQGGNGNDTLLGYATELAAGANEVDTLTGGSGRDVFILGDSSRYFYSLGREEVTLAGENLIVGGKDYALIDINDFNPQLGDVIRLKGSASQYYTSFDTIIYDKNPNGYDGDQVVAVFDNVTFFGQVPTNLANANGFEFV
jgi:Ca2+-binding RTX toxin-like protein